MKNRAKMISLLMAVCMMLTLLPAVAFAASGVATSVKIGGVELNSTYQWYVNGTNGAPGTRYDTEPASWNAKFENGTLTLNGLIIVNRSSADTYRGIRWDGTGNRMLTIDLLAGTTNIVTNTQGSAVVGDKGYSGVNQGAALTVQGSGTLVATGKNSGIWVFEKVIIKGNATVIATGVTGYGIADNDSYDGGSFVLEGNAKVYADGGKAGLSYKGETVTITGGTLIARGGTQALEKDPDLSGYSYPTVYASDRIDVAGPVWDNNSSLNSTNYKQVKVTGAGNNPRPNTGYVFFDADNTSATGDTAYNTYTIGNEFNLSPNGFAVSGKAFEGWNSISPVDTISAPYANGATVSGLKIPNTILYAKWGDGSTNPAPKTYSISFNRNTQDSAATGTMEAQIFTEGVPQAIKANAFSVPGYVFTGWNTEQNGGGTPYDDEEVITLNEDIMNGRSGFSLYAQWEMDTGTNPGGPGTNPTDPTPGGPGTPSHSHSHIDVWYIAGNSFGTSKSAVPTAVEIDGQPVGFTGDGREFTVSCIPAGAKWVTVRWNSTSVTTNFTPDANAYCTEIAIPKTGDSSVICYALMAVIAAAGAMGKK